MDKYAYTLTMLGTIVLAVLVYFCVKFIATAIFYAPSSTGEIFGVLAAITLAVSAVYLANITFRDGF